MDEQVKRIAVSIMLVIDLLVIIYVASLGNWTLGTDQGHLYNLEDRILSLLPIMMVVMWIKLFADIYLGYYIARSFRESIGLLDKALADTNWFLRPAVKTSIACIVLQFILVIFDAAFDEDHDIALDSLHFWDHNMFLITTIGHVFILITLIALYFFTLEKQ